jgi:hypothetical protein
MPISKYDLVMTKENLRELEVLDAKRTVVLANKDYSKVNMCEEQML